MVDFTRVISLKISMLICGQSFFGMGIFDGLGRDTIDNGTSIGQQYGIWDDMGT